MINWDNKKNERNKEKKIKKINYSLNKLFKQIVIND